MIRDDRCTCNCSFSVHQLARWYALFLQFWLLVGTGLMLYGMQRVEWLNIYASFAACFIFMIGIIIVGLIGSYAKRPNLFRIYLFCQFVFTVAMFLFVIYQALMTTVSVFVPHKIKDTDRKLWIVGLITAWVVFMIAVFNSYFGVYVPIRSLFLIEDELKEKAKRTAENSENSENEASTLPPAYSSQDVMLTTF